VRSGRLHTRLRRLEAAVPTGCPACHHRRGGTLLHISQQNPDGTLRSVSGDPQPCERCGEVPEAVVEIVEVVVSTREECERFQTKRRCDDVGAVP
jgi:hypothetical protein